MSGTRGNPVACFLILLAGLALAAPAWAGPVLGVKSPAGTKTFTLAQLKKLPATAGFAGVLSSSGKITAPSRYRGVALEDLMAAAGGYDATQNLVITARDGYSMTYSHDQVTAGTFVAYDPGTGDSLATHEPLTAILTWEHEGKPLKPVEDGPMRVMVVSASPRQVTDGHWSIKWVTKMAIEPSRSVWTLDLEGARTERMDRATFESGAAPGCHGVTWKDEGGRSWTGIPLWLLVGRVDDTRKHGTGAFADDLAGGYTVELAGAGGATVTLAGSRVARDDKILVAHQLDGAPLTEAAFPLQLTGAGLKGEERLGGITKIVVRRQAAEPAPGK